MKPLQAVVIGGSGQIGGWLLRSLAERGHPAIGTYATVAYPELIQLDAADLTLAASWVRDQKPEVVFYPAGFTWVDGCERDPGRARSCNVEQPLNLARAAMTVGARFVYFSTDYVFDGEAGPYDEDAEPHPLSAYGDSKREAELALARECGDRQLTVRTTWVFGPERQGKNFAYQLARTLRSDQTLTCPSDQVSNPSYGPDVARATVELVEREVSGLIHVAGPEVLDRVQFARTLAERFGLDRDLITGRPTAEINQGAPRPLAGGLRTVRLDSLLPGVMRPLSETTSELLERLKSDSSLAQL